YRTGTVRINACGDSRLRGLRSRKPIGFRQWVVHFLNQIASNPGAGAAGISSEMLQMGAGLGMLGAVGGMMQNMTSPYMNGMGAMTGIPQPMAGQMMAGMQGGAGQTMDGMQNGAGQTMAGMQGGAGQTMDGMQGGAGQMAPVSAADPVEVLGKLKRLLDAGLIEQEEYDAKKREILANL
ncbi:MAG: SHOCT domain-containing protein, partial [Lachnospiraceae bacterium]|nr:SHOCT domain-containing protein [Lachnospiraceae bacterium]